MEELPRQRLAELIGRYGRGIIDDPRRTEALLRDICGPHRREVNVLVGALREGVPSELVGSKSNMPAAVLLGRLADRLDQNLGMARDAALWAVESWALALGVVSIGDVTPDHGESGVREHVAISGSAPTTATIETVPTSSSPERSTPAVVPPQTLMVAKAGGGGFTTLDEAIQQAPGGSTILVRPGVYREDITLADLQGQLTIAGDGPKEQIILEGIPALRVWSGSVAVRGVTFRRPALPITEESPFAVVEVSLEGSLVLQDCDAISAQAKGTLIDVSGKCSIERCRIQGGNVGVDFSYASMPTIEGSTISGAADRGINVTSGNPQMRRCVVESDNQGIIFMTDSSGLVEDSEVHSRGKIGIALVHSSGPTIRRSKVRADNGPAISVQNEANGVIEDTEINGPRGYFALHLAGKSPIIRNCRIEGGIVAMGSSTGVVEGCAIVSDTYAVQIKESSQTTIRGCTLQGKSGGVSVRDSGGGAVENCDLRGSKPSWDIESGTTLTRTNNRD